MRLALIVLTVSLLCSSAGKVQCQEASKIFNFIVTTDQLASTLPKINLASDQELRCNSADQT